jgi:hypothetical protein
VYRPEQLLELERRRADEVNGWDGLGSGSALTPPRHGWYFTCIPAAVQPTACTTYGDGTSTACSYIDLQNTVTHEVGHFIGLRHPCTPAQAAEPGLPSCNTVLPDPEVPYTARTMSPTTQPREITKRDLSADEVQAVCDIYPASSGGCGCGAGGAGGGVALLLAALALRPGHRRSPASRRRR